MQRISLNGVELEIMCKAGGAVAVDPWQYPCGWGLSSCSLSPASPTTIAASPITAVAVRAKARPRPLFTIAQQAADGRARLDLVGIARCTMSPATRLWRRYCSDTVGTRCPHRHPESRVLEPPLVASIPSGPTFWDGVASVRQQLYDPGDTAGAIDAFLMAVVAANHRQIIRGGPCPLGP